MLSQRSGVEKTAVRAELRSHSSVRRSGAPVCGLSPVCRGEKTYPFHSPFTTSRKRSEATKCDTKSGKAEIGRAHV